MPYKRETSDESKKDETIENKSQDGLMSPSLTPLESSKHFNFPNEEEEIQDDSRFIENEFDKLSTERVQRVNVDQKPMMTLSKKSFPVALEPNVLILNNNSEVKNLSTLTEDDDESHSQCDEDQNNLSDSQKDLTDPKNDADNISVTKDKIFKRLNSESDASSLSETRDLFDCNQEEQLVNLLKNRSLPENKYFARDRSASIGTLNLNKTPISQLIGDQNRTMLFQVLKRTLNIDFY